MSPAELETGWTTVDGRVLLWKLIPRVSVNATMERQHGITGAPNSLAKDFMSRLDRRINQFAQAMVDREVAGALRSAERTTRERKLRGRVKGNLISFIESLTAVDALERVSIALREEGNDAGIAVTDDERSRALAVISAALGAEMTAVCDACHGASTVHLGPWGTRRPDAECADCFVIKITLTDEVSAH